MRVAFAATTPTPTIAMGAKGPVVTKLQQYLTKLGFPASADGVFGAGTRAAVQNFQRSAALTADGVVGPYTWTAISEKLGATLLITDAEVSATTSGGSSSEGSGAPPASVPTSGGFSTMQKVGLGVLAVAGAAVLFSGSSGGEPS